jgi:hypothetical protein
LFEGSATLSSEASPEHSRCDCEQTRQLYHNRAGDENCESFMSAKVTIDGGAQTEVLALAGSNMDGEALAALRTAQKMLRTGNLSFTDVAQSLGSGVKAGGGCEITRLHVRLADAESLLRAYRKELNQSRAKQSASAARTLKRAEQARCHFPTPANGVKTQTELSPGRRCSSAGSRSGPDVGPEGGLGAYAKNRQPWRIRPEPRT